MHAERDRLLESNSRDKYWKRWGPYLAERSWGNPREDYSRDGAAWDYFPHDHARSRAYRWTEDGIAGISDNHQRLCFAFAFWNGRDPILKERLFGLGGPEGNHGEDVKEYYYYLDSTPTHSYMKYLYKYPQAAFPYSQLVEVNRRRSKTELEYELIDTGVFDEDRYFDIFVEYAKNGPDDILVRLTAINRGPDPATLYILPTVWFRNTWSWGYGTPRPELAQLDSHTISCKEQSLGEFKLWLEEGPPVWFTENESNAARLWGLGDGRHTKDAFHRYLVDGEKDAVHSDQRGTKACGFYRIDLQPRAEQVLHFRLNSGNAAQPDFDRVFLDRIEEANAFYSFAPSELSDDARMVQRQAFAGLLWNKQFYHYVVEQWLKGDPAMPPPPPERRLGRNHTWIHIYNDDVLSMPDKWEYPWFAAWDLGFHTIPFSLIDPDFAKRQLSLLLREWYQSPNGQLPAYEWEFSDVNPPVHPWACLRVFKIDKKLTGKADYQFLESAFHKLLMNFTWWVNRKDSRGDNIFEGGFLGLDNIGVFDRSKPLPTGGFIEQADGTAWMAMFSLNMLKIAIELTPHDPSYEDIASKFFEHFLYIASAMNRLGDGGLWDEEDGFFYDWLRLPDGRKIPLRLRSMVGLIPLFAVTTLDAATIEKLPGFKRRMTWFVKHRPDLCGNIASITRYGMEERLLLSIVPPSRLRRVLGLMLDENEFLSPHGIRGISRFHKEHPFVLRVDEQEYRVDYEPAESSTGLFGGNSNWRGPVWFPVNFLMIESLQKFHHYFGDEMQVECPTGSGVSMNLSDVASHLSRRLSRLFLRDRNGRRPVFGQAEKFQTDPYFRDHILFYEYFDGDHGAGLGASHQTGWTALVAKLLQQSGE